MIDCTYPQTEYVADYCEQEIDKLSYKITHGMYHDEADRQYQIGSMDAYEDIYRMINQDPSKDLVNPSESDSCIRDCF